MAACALVSTAAVLTGACKGSTPVAPPVVINSPPTIESLATTSPRAEADQPIQVTAVVKDTESTIDKLEHAWSASPNAGAFDATTSFTSGNKATNTWRSPKGQRSPDLYTITLTVTESYTSAGQAKQNRVASNTTVHYNDSPAEVTELGYDFLVNKFGQFNVSPAEAVSRFSDNCPGKAAELEDVEDNRQEVHVLSASFPAPVVSFESQTKGSVVGPCTFEDIPNSGPNSGKRQFVSGTCLLTTIYEDFRWYLCDSYFNGPYTTTLASLRGRVPGGPYVR